jgi:hypothetical protein
VPGSVVGEPVGLVVAARVRQPNPGQPRVDRAEQMVLRVLLLLRLLVIEAVEQPARMFSLADQHTTAGMLAAAGVTDIAFTYVREPVYYGADSAQGYEFVTGLQTTKDMLARLDPAATEDALRGLRVTLAKHTTLDGVLFAARTWIITARTPHRQRPQR